jgi:hypothetical protein
MLRRAFLKAVSAVAAAAVVPFKALPAFATRAPQAATFSATMVGSTITSITTHISGRRSYTSDVIAVGDDGVERRFSTHGFLDVKPGDRVRISYNA